jgi:hypothetical protein
VSFAAKTLYVASKRVFIVVSVYFVIDSVRKLLKSPSYKLKTPKFEGDIKITETQTLPLDMSSNGAVALTQTT